MARARCARAARTAAETGSKHVNRRRRADRRRRRPRRRRRSRRRRGPRRRLAEPRSRGEGSRGSITISLRAGTRAASGRECSSWIAQPRRRPRRPAQRPERRPRGVDRLRRSADHGRPGGDVVDDDGVGPDLRVGRRLGDRADDLRSGADLTSRRSSPRARPGAKANRSPRAISPRPFRPPPGRRSRSGRGRCRSRGG